MKRLLISLLISFTLIGCTEYVHKWQLEKAKGICKDKGGIDYILANTESAEKVRCNNGHWQDIKIGF